MEEFYRFLHLFVSIILISKQIICVFNKNTITLRPIIAIKNKAKALEKIKETVAFFGEEVSVKELNPQFKLPTMEEMMKNRIEDYSHKELK